jgi:hypothetical protein
VTVFQNTGDFTKTLGSWWSGEYDGRDEIHTFVDALVHVARSQHDLFEQVIQAADVYAVAPFRFTQFARIRLHRQTGRQAAIRYDSGLQYDNGWRYDQTQTSGNVFVVDSKIANIAMIVDKPGNAEWSISQPFDFTLENGQLVLSPRALQQLSDVYAFRVESDAEFVDVWARGVEYDYEDVFAAFGAVHRLYGKSSVEYGRVVQAFHRCLVAGSTQGTVLEFIGACVNEPLTKHAAETVEHVYTAQQKTTVVTNREVYHHDSAFTTLPAVGDVLPRHSLLSDRVAVYADITELPLPCIAVPANWLPACVGGTVYLPNTNTALQVTTAAGFTRVAWDMPGDSGVNQRFFDIAHANGIANAVPVAIPIDGVLPPENVIVKLDPAGETWYQKATLAHLLDTRKLSVGEPTVQNMPSAIVPAQVVVGSVMQNSVWGLYIRGDLSTRNTQYSAIAKLSQVLPPHTGLYLVLEPFETREIIGIDVANSSVDSVDVTTALQNNIATNTVVHKVQFVDIV